MAIQKLPKSDFGKDGIVINIPARWDSKKQPATKPPKPSAPKK